MPQITTKPLLIGQAPSRFTQNRNGGIPFSGHSGQRLATLARMSLDQFLASVEAVNLLDNYPGREGGDETKGDAFDSAQARTAAAILVKKFHSRTVLLAGRRVAAAFGIELAPLAHVALHGGTVYLLPHPSGVNTWYNNLANVRAASTLLQCLIKRREST